MKHIIIIILTLLSITINAQGIRLNSKQSVIDSTRLNATGDSLYYYQNGVLLSTGAIGSGSMITGTGTANYLPKFTGNKTLGNSLIYDNGTNVGIGTTTPSAKLEVSGGDANFDSGTLYVDESENRVGIGTSSPSAKLEVSGGNVNFNLGAYRFTLGDTNDYLYFGQDGGGSYAQRVGSTSAKSGFRFQTFFGNDYKGFRISDAAGFEYYDGPLGFPTDNKFVIDTSGNVGIGETSPSAKLDVVGNTELNGGLTQSGGDANFDNNTLYVDESANNVGIGTNSPTARLEVWSDQISGGSEDILMTGVGRNIHLTMNALAIRRAVIDFQSAGVSQWTMGRGDSDELEADKFFIGTGRSGGNNAKLVINQSGNVGIGDTSPDSKLEVNGSATNTSANDESSDDTIDFSLSNIAYTDNTGNSITLTNIKDGGAYTLISTATNVSSAVTFTASGFTIKYMGTVARTNGRQHIYSFIVADGNVYVTMGTEN